MSSKEREASPEASPLKGPAPKAVPEDTSDVQFEDGIPLNPMADPSVQFMSAPANGDAKVEIGDGGSAPTFVGLGKEELMKYANDPFWIRLRWLLFFLFWILWIAMLVGAIVIIVLAPRCAEKKTTADTFYQMKARDLIKDGKLEEQAQYLQNLGVETIVITEALQHEIGQPEAVLSYDKLDESVEPGLFAQALEELKKKGIKILMQFVPNHSGTKHEWFTELDKSDFYVRMPYDNVKQSNWVTQGREHAAWIRDPKNADQAYLQQFSGDVADLNFQNDAVVDTFKQILSNWREKDINGFVISKASFLIENLDELMQGNVAMRNQPGNVKAIGRMIGISTSGPNLVELDTPDDETIRLYIERGLTPIIKSTNISNGESARQALENFNKHPMAVVDLSGVSGSPQKSRLVTLLASAGGSHTLLNHANTNTANKADTDFLKKLVEFQKKNPRGKGANIQLHNEGELVSLLRTDGDEHLIITNLGAGDATFSLDKTDFNKTSDAKGVVELVTPGAKQNDGDSFEGTITLGGESGIVIKLEEKKEVAE